LKSASGAKFNILKEKKKAGRSTSLFFSPTTLGQREMGFQDEETSAMVSENSNLKRFHSFRDTLPTDDFDARSASFALDVRSPSLDSSIRCDLLVLSGACPNRDLSSRAIALEVGRLPRPP
jgi:hypothetical protein